MERSYTSFDHLPLTLRVEQVAAVLNVGRNTAYELVRCGAIQSIKVGRQIRIPKQSVISYLETQNPRKDKGD